MKPLNEFCKQCNNKLNSVYVRKGESFWSLKELWYCAECDMIYEYQMVEKKKTASIKIANLGGKDE